MIETPVEVIWMEGIELRVRTIWRENRGQLKGSQLKVTREETYVRLVGLHGTPIGGSDGCRMISKLLGCSRISRQMMIVSEFHAELAVFVDGKLPLLDIEVDVRGLGSRASLSAGEVFGSFLD
ncbi:hypothetical protein TIFTF001_027741 [Ficus carica]|uniref:Uncharacterized protein n=1 Tax=Ficus carica TaxID=3494 RepID=A0AA88DNL3_FICCA|nr:hypothetical protein TIFTF001_027741 [Ficus carica]